LGRNVALKFLPAEVMGNPAAMERFLREARAAAALNHPNICVVHEIGVHEGRHFIAMELLEGQTLRQRLARGRLKTDELLDLAIQIADALHAATRKASSTATSSQPIFCDSKRQAKVLDFGLAKIAGIEKRRGKRGHHGRVPHESGERAGTVAYMSPEQARGKILTRDGPFLVRRGALRDGDGAAGIRGQHLGGHLQPILAKAPTAPRSVNPELPGELERIIHKALEKERRLRYQSASDIRADLQRLKRDQDSRRQAPRRRLRARRRSPCSRS